jgi:pimeloyl-ACP methyl ester carboxylesterase
MNAGIRFLAAVICAGVACNLGAAGAAPASPLHTAPCIEGTTKVQSVCGTFRVYEDRHSRTGRTLDIHFVVLKASKPTNQAIFWNPGGPGAGATQFAPYIADGKGEEYLARLRDRYDVVFVDNRGTGLSHELRCALFSASDPQSYFLQEWPDEQLRACRAALEKDADLSDYTTDIAADDLDDIRTALGYPKIVLSGISDGTSLFLDYARRHPRNVESILLQGVAPPHFLIIPLEDARGAQLAMDRLESDCAADPSCNSHFPNFRSQFATLVQRFAHGPIAVRVESGPAHALRTVRLSKEVFADRLRQTLYSNGPAAYVPYIVDRASAGDYVPLGRMIEYSAIGLDRLVPAGANLSVTCAEDVPFITDADVANTSADTFMGPGRVLAQQHACGIWKVRQAPASFQDPVRTSAPVFMISGADDPTTPPEYSAEALAYFPNGRRLLIANASHDTGVPCAMTLAEQFIRDRSARNLQTSTCSAMNHRPSFATSMAGFGAD